jgi:dipeptidase E
VKLYLSSYRIPVLEPLLELVDKPQRHIKTAILPNSYDYYADLARKYQINDRLLYFQAKGFVQLDIVDLRDYRKSDELYEKLSAYDVVWGSGGNTFCLRQEMRRSGFDEIIQALLENGTVYAGDSAGAVVVGSSLRGVELADKPEYTEEAIYEGIRLIDRVIVPHNDNVYFADSIQAMKALHPKQSLLTINDNQAYVVNGGKTTFHEADQSEI